MKLINEIGEIMFRGAIIISIPLLLLLIFANLSYAIETNPTQEIYIKKTPQTYLAERGEVLIIHLFKYNETFFLKIEDFVFLKIQGNAFNKIGVLPRHKEINGTIFNFNNVSEYLEECAVKYCFNKYPQWQGWICTFYEADGKLRDISFSIIECSISPDAVLTTLKYGNHTIWDINDTQGTNISIYDNDIYDLQFKSLYVFEDVLVFNLTEIYTTNNPYTASTEPLPIQKIMIFFFWILILAGFLFIAYEILKRKIKKKGKEK